MSDDGGGGGHGGPVWLLTYGDLITLLVAFFVMLISMSTINVNKSKKQIEVIGRTFGGLGESLLDEEPLLSGGNRPLDYRFEKDLDVLKNLETEAPSEETQALEQCATAKEMREFLTGVLKEGGGSQSLDIEEVKVGCKIKISANDCFRSGEAVLKKEAHVIFNKLGTTLRMISGKIIIDASVESATKDDERVTKANNLSIDRAANICDYLVKHEDIMQKRFAISGYQIADPKERNIITMVVFKK